MAKTPKRRAPDYLQKHTAEIKTSCGSHEEKLARLNDLRARYTEMSLQKPIVRPNRLLVSAADAEKQIAEMRAQTIVSLAEKYKIPEKIGESDFWVSISWHLMNEFVPGFRVLERPPRERGRAKNPNLKLKQSEKDFVEAIDRRRDRGETLIHACEAVFTRFKYKKANTLRVAYGRAKDKLKELAAMEADLAEWKARHAAAASNFETKK